jgi:GH15 family glucan-1,4-alpha-glucosidase
MAYKRISDYGVIGDMHSAALVGLDGSIDWLCFPSFASASVFAAILDDEQGGRFRLCPTAPYRSEQHYLPNTNVLSTTFVTEGGRVELMDLMPLAADDAQESDHEVLRIVRAVEGTVEMSCTFQPRLDYARGTTELHRAPGGAVAQQNGARLALAAPCDLTLRPDSAEGTFIVRARDELIFQVQWEVERPPNTAGWEQRRDFTIQKWRDLVRDVNYEGQWRDAVVRSVLALHLLVYMPTGAIVAAATTSLPEWIGGDRNWDYRYCWIRDAAFTLDAFDRLGYISETARFMRWLSAFCESCGDRLKPLYGIHYEEDLSETTLDHLDGYRGSRPVRIGNAASSQLQLDIFGDVMVALATFQRSGGEITDAMWASVESFVEAVVNNWRRPDRSMWEVRGRPRHFVHSKVMCWLALDRAIELAETLGKNADLKHWRATRDAIHADVLRKGWNEAARSFSQYYGGDFTDASLLMMPLVGFLPANDPRLRSTVQRIRAELEEGGLLRRYPYQKTDDGFDTNEGVFTMCTLWLVGCLTLAGELDEAQRIFEHVLACGNHLGLFSEMTNPDTGEALGNLPQAFTHVSLIHTARNLDLALRRHETSHEEMQIGKAR